MYLVFSQSLSYFLSLRFFNSITRMNRGRGITSHRGGGGGGGRFPNPRDSHSDTPPPQEFSPMFDSTDFPSLKEANSSAGRGKKAKFGSSISITTSPQTAPSVERPNNNQRNSPNRLMGSNSSEGRRQKGWDSFQQSNHKSSSSPFADSGGNGSRGTFQSGRSSPRKRVVISPSRVERGDNNQEPFDICPKRTVGVKLNTPLHLRKKEERKEREISKQDPQILRPGMVLLKHFLSRTHQIDIVKKCRDSGIAAGGFYQPGYKDGAKLRLKMMCFGKNWDPETRLYEEHRAVDGESCPCIPDIFRKLVKEAIEVSHQCIKENHGLSNPEEELPWMEPDLCIVNFYSKTGKLGLHQDRDESKESLKKGLPVVSFSLGDSAPFLYGDDRDVDNAHEVLLESGDVLIFGGESRHVFHGIPSITPGTAPKFLKEETNLIPGRLNLTFRKY